MKHLLLICITLSFSTILWAQDAEEIAFVKAVLNKAQAQSFKANREFCGYIGLTSDNRFKATPAKRGRLDSCYPKEPPLSLDVFASYHTHSAFDYDADSEVPSYRDIKADMEEEVDGYIATPGGRLWFIDSIEGIAYQICGIGCLRSDKSFEKNVFGPIKQSYTARELRRRDP